MSREADREALDQFMRDADGWWMPAREMILDAGWRPPSPVTDRYAPTRIALAGLIHRTVPDDDDLARLCEDEECLWYDIADAILAAGWVRSAPITEPETWEYGVEYEINSTASEFTAAHSRKQSEKWVAQSPTDTGLRRRRPAGPWVACDERLGDAS